MTGIEVIAMNGGIVLFILIPLVIILGATMEERGNEIRKLKRERKEGLKKQRDAVLKELEDLNE